MYKDFRYIKAGQNEIHRYGRKAVEKVRRHLEPKNGYISFPVDGEKYWSIGTSEGKYGEFCRIGDTIFSVNRYGFAYAKAGTDKGDKLIKALESMIEEMHRINASRFTDTEEDGT